MTSFQSMWYALSVYILHTSLLQHFVPVSSALALAYVKGKVVQSRLEESGLTHW